MRRSKRDGAGDNTDVVILYECRCGGRFISTGTKIVKPRNHRKECEMSVTDIPRELEKLYAKNHLQPRYPYRRKDNYEQIKKLFKNVEDQKVIEGFHVYFGNFNKLVEWIDDNKFTPLDDLKYIKDPVLKTKLLRETYLEDLKTMKEEEMEEIQNMIKKFREDDANKNAITFRPSTSKKSKKSSPKEKK